jgi:CubicO group peptidase (beta-lactamase class C family)
MEHSMQSTKFSQQGLDQLHGAMQGYVERGERPGIVTLLSRDGETHVDAIGTHAFGSERPMRRDTIFRIASITKPVVAAATLTLVQEGKLRLDEPIDRWIPELAQRRVLRRLDGPLDDTVPAKRPILVQDLLTLRMGLGAIMSAGRFPILDALLEQGIFTPFRMPTQPSADEWLARLSKLPLMDQPGEVWRYDTSITLLGALVERVTGQTLHDALRERLFAPLGMKDTGFVVRSESLDRLPVAYQRNPATGALEVWDPSGSESFFATLPGFAGAHGGLVSTADDYLAFARMLLGQGHTGGPPLISPELLGAMMSDQIPDDVKQRSSFVPGFWEQRGWGYGLSILRHAVPGEPRGCGWDGGYGTCAYWDRETGVIVILLSQRLVESPTYSDIYHDFFHHAYRAAGL